MKKKVKKMSAKQQAAIEKRKAEKQVVYSAGFDAYNAGLSIDDNPYRVGDDGGNEAQWDRGWSDAEKEDK